MPDWVAILVLGIIEGLTEFLPVSSTGHLVITEHWLERPQSDLFNVVVQCGAVLAVLMVFWTRVKQFAREWRAPATRDYLLKLLTAFVVTGLGGVALKKAGLKLPESAVPVAWATLAGGVLILVIERWLKGKPLRDEVTWPMAVAAGAAQLLAAVFPGTSRSGATILIALAMGCKRPVATEFSFLLGIPTLLAAGALVTASAINHGETVPWALVLVGAVSAAVTAFMAVKWLLRFVQAHTFNAFGWYRIALGALILAWELVKR